VGLVALAVVLLGVWIARQQALQERLETTEERLAEQGQMTDELRERLSGLERANERLSEKFDTQVDRIVRDSQPTSESRTQRQDFPSHVLDSVYLVSAVNNRNSVQNIGTCFSVHSSGLLVTNYHVVRNAHSVYVTYRDQYFPAKVISYDASLDVAVMQVQFPTEPLPVRRLSQETLGVDAFAIGFPWARRTGGEATVTKGIVSSVTEDRDMLITDATINPGNSGGPLVDSEGRVMGMNTSVMRTERVEGAAFAVTISSILQML
jgi:S1-C subfamily serine protease